MATLAGGSVFAAVSLDGVSGDARPPGGPADGGLSFDTAVTSPATAAPPGAPRRATVAQLAPAGLPPATGGVSTLAAGSSIGGDSHQRGYCSCQPHRQHHAVRGHQPRHPHTNRPTPTAGAGVRRDSSCYQWSVWGELEFAWSAKGQALVSRALCHTLGDGCSQHEATAQVVQKPVNREALTGGSHD